MRTSSGKYSLFSTPVHRTALPPWGSRDQTRPHEQQIRVADLCPGTVGQDFSSVSQAGTRLPPTAQHLSASLGCPSQNSDPPSAPGGSSAATRTNLRVQLLRFSPWEKQRLEPAPDPGRHFPLHSQNRHLPSFPPSSLRASTRSGNQRGHRGVAAPALCPGCACRAPGGASPGHPTGAKNTQWLLRDGVTQPRGAAAPPGPRGSVPAGFGGLGAARGVQHPHRPH